MISKNDCTQKKNLLDEVSAVCGIRDEKQLITIDHSIENSDLFI